MSISVRFKAGLGGTEEPKPRHPLRWEARIFIGILSVLAILIGTAGLFVACLVLWAIFTA